MFKERFLFLTNEATIGVFIVDSATVFVALSGNGEFVKVYRGDSSSIHLTRFCPVAAHLLVQKLLAFRNRYAHRPYFCDRFQKISAPFSGSRTISWSLQTKHQRTTKNCWTVYSDGNGRSLAAVCPFRRKLCYLSDAIFLPDTSIGHHRSQQASEFRVIRHVTVVPLAHAPAFFHGDYARETSLHNHDSSILSSCISTEIPMSIECGASDSSSACEFFHEIEHELTFLKSIRKYPTSIDFAVRVEKIDEEIFLSTSNYSHSQCCGTPETRTQDITVENWIQPQKIIGRIEMRTKISQQHSDEKVSVEDEKLDEKSLCVEDFGCNGDGPVLTLKGDYFTFYQHQSILSDNNDTSDGDNNVSALGLSIHVSLLDQYCEEIDCMEFEINLHLDDKNINKNKNENKDRSKNENMDEYENKTHDKNTLEKKITEDNEEIFSELRSMPSYHRNHSNVKRIFSGDHRCHKSDGNIRDREGSSSQIQNVLRTYRQHAIRLLEYREYLQPRMKHLNASSNIPLCLRSIYDEKKNSFSKERMQIANLPGGSSVREILGEQEQEHRCTHRPRFGHGQRREGEGEGERGYGGSYYIKDGDLHQIFCDDTDSLISSSSFSNGHDIHSSSSSSSRSSSSSSSSSKRFDVHRNTHTVNTNYDENNTVKLHTSFGAKFTAFPYSPIISVSTDTSDTSYGWNSTYAHGRGDLGEGWGSDRSNRNAEDQIELERFSSRARSGFPQEGRLISEMFDRVRGVFPDRSQVDLCLKTKVRDLLHFMYMSYDFISIGLIFFFNCLFYMNLTFYSTFPSLLLFPDLFCSVPFYPVFFCSVICRPSFPIIKILCQVHFTLHLTLYFIFLKALSIYSTSLSSHTF